MKPYKEMYYRLFNATTKAIEVLQEAQQETEEMYISAGKPSFKNTARIRINGIN